MGLSSPSVKANSAKKAAAGVSFSTIKNSLIRAIDRINGKKYVHVLHIGKTGGTAVKHALKPYRRTGRYVIRLHSHNVSLRDVPEGEYVVFFLRDPINRFISGFYSRQRQGMPRRFCPWSKDENMAFQKFATPNELAVALSSADKEEKNHALRAISSVEHVKSSYWDWFEDESYYLSRLPDIFFVGFQEDLSADFDILKSELGLPPGVSLPADDIRSHKTPGGFDRTLEEKAVENLKKWYARDYEFIRLCQNTFEKTKMKKRVILSGRIFMADDLNLIIDEGKSFLLKKSDHSTTVGLLKGSDFGLDHDLLLKRFNYRGVFDFLLHKLFNSRAKRLWKRNLRLHKKGLPVPEPLLYKEESFRHKYSFFLSSAVENAESLGDICRKGLFQIDGELLKKLAQTIAEWHLKGAVHGDLKWPNILVQKGGAGYRVFLTDIDQSRLYSAPCLKGIRKDLKRFYRFGLEAGAQDWVESGFFPEYASLLPEDIKSQINFSEIKNAATKEWIKAGRKRFS